MAESETHDPVQAPTRTPSSQSFEGELLSLCHVLERWRAERKIALAAQDDFPPFDWRAARMAAFFFVTYWLAVFALPFARQSLWAQVVAIVVMAISVAAGSVLFGLQATGIATTQFWRGLWRLVSTKDNYPFTSVLAALKIDFAATEKLQPFSTPVLRTARERFALEESDLKERITLIVGNPTLVAILGLLAAAWAPLQGLQTPLTKTTVALSIVSAVAFLITVYGARLRIALLELTHCRGLLSLEIARRKSDSREPSGE
jgi:hypothetical protein